MALPNQSCFLFNILRCRSTTDKLEKYLLFNWCFAYGILIPLPRHDLIIDYFKSNSNKTCKNAGF